MPKEASKINSEEFDILSFHESDGELMASGSELAFTDTEDEMASLSHFSSIEHDINDDNDPLIPLDDGVEDIVKNLPSTVSGGASNVGANKVNFDSNQNPIQGVKPDRTARGPGTTSSDASLPSPVENPDYSFPTDVKVNCVNKSSDMNPLLALHSKLSKNRFSKSSCRKVINFSAGRSGKRRIVVIMCGDYNAEVQQFIIRFYQQYPLTCLYWYDESSGETSLLETPDGHKDPARLRVLNLLDQNLSHPNLRIRFWGSKSVNKYVNENVENHDDKRGEGMSVVPVCLSDVSESSLLPATKHSPIEIDADGTPHTLSTLSDLTKVSYCSLVDAALCEKGDTKICDLVKLYKRGYHKDSSINEKLYALVGLVIILFIGVYFSATQDRQLVVDPQLSTSSNLYPSNKILDSKELALIPDNSLSTFLAPIQSDLRKLLALLSQIVALAMSHANEYTHSAARYLNSLSASLRELPEWHLLTDHVHSFGGHARGFGQYLKELEQQIKGNTTKFDEMFLQHWETVKQFFH